MTNYINKFLEENYIQLGETFTISDVSGIYRFTETSLEVNNGGNNWGIAKNMFMKLMTGECIVDAKKFPMRETTYYYVNHKGQVNEKIYKRDYIDVALVNFGNAFPSKAIANKNSNDVLTKIRTFE